MDRVHIGLHCTTQNAVVVLSFVSYFEKMDNIALCIVIDHSMSAHNAKLIDGDLIPHHHRPPPITHPHPHHWRIASH